MLIDDFIGIPFVDQGRTADGCDCAGLVMLVMRQYGIELPDVNLACHSDLVPGAMSKELAKMRKIDSPQVPCLVAFALIPDLPGWASHLGVVIDKRRFLHTSSRIGSSSLCRLDHPYYANHLVGYWAP